MAINFRLGYSHPIIMLIPPNVNANVVNQNKIVLKGPDYQQLTQFAAQIRSKRPPEPYNGKGVFVDNEKVIRKEGKKSK
jgi:large subunit ribosomal protein L6